MVLCKGSWLTIAVNHGMLPATTDDWLVADGWLLMMVDGVYCSCDTGVLLLLQFSLCSRENVGSRANKPQANRMSSVVGDLSLPPIKKSRPGNSSFKREGNGSLHSSPSTPLVIIPGCHP